MYVAVLKVFANRGEVFLVFAKIHNAFLQAGAGSIVFVMSGG